MAKLADFLSMEEVKEIVEYEEHEDEFDLEKEIVIGNEALSDLKLMQSIVAGLEEFTEEETQELTEFLNDKQEEVGYEKTEFTPDNLQVTIESLSKDMKMVQKYYKHKTFQAKPSFERYSTEDFSAKDKIQKNLAGFFSAINVFGDKASKLKAKAQRVLAMVEKEESDTSKEEIKSASSAILGFIPGIEGLSTAKEYIKVFDAVYGNNKRDKIYQSLLDIASVYAEDKEKASNELSKIKFLPVVNSKVVKNFVSGEQQSFIYLAPVKSVGISLFPNDKVNPELPEIAWIETPKLLKDIVVDASAKVVSKSEIVTYLKEVISFCDTLVGYTKSKKTYIDKLSKMLSPEKTGTFGFYAFHFITSDIKDPFKVTLEMVEAGVDFCYDHYK